MTIYKDYGVNDINERVYSILLYNKQYEFN
jgi:hypothetical protein